MLNPREKRTAWKVLLIIIAGALASAVMVGSVLPFLTVLAKPMRIETTPALNWAYETLGFTSIYNFLIALGFATFAMILISSMIQIAKTWAVASFAMMRVHSISHRLLATYLAQPYEFFLGRHSGDMSPRILGESGQAVNGFLQPAAELIASGLTTLAIVGLLLWLEPIVATISFAILAGIYGIVYVFTRLALRRLGDIRVNNNRKRFRLVNESLSGIKDIKLLGREAAYLDRYAIPSRKVATTQTQIAVLSQVPQFALQSVAFGGIIMLCLVLINPTTLASGNAIGDLLPTLGLFAMAGQRLMPELSRIYRSLAMMQASSAAIDAVHEDLELRKQISRSTPPQNEGLSFKKSLVLEAVDYSYPKSDRVGIQEINLTIVAGEKIGIVGSTGAGKTTIADIILGLLQPHKGRITADGSAISSENVHEWMMRVGYVPQDIFLIDACVTENIAFGMPHNQIDSHRVRNAARIARIDQFIENELPDAYETRIGERGVRLSGGQRQRIGIARALYHDADLIVFDEATSALDNLTEADVIAAIDALPGDKTVIMIAHRLSTVKRCDRIVVLDKGRIVGCDTWTALMASNARFQQIAQLGDTA